MRQAKDFAPKPCAGSRMLRREHFHHSETDDKSLTLTTWWMRGSYREIYQVSS